MFETRFAGLKARGITIFSVFVAIVLTACGGSGSDPVAVIEDEPVAEGAVVVVKAASALQLQVSGAIFTTDSTCTATNDNLFASKDAVYLDGGPRKPGAAGLPPSPENYFVKVTDPSGLNLLGQTPTASVTVDSGGNIVGCYQLSAILTPTGQPGPFSYLTTTNLGGEYKVWLSKDSNFPNNLTKTDNFKVGPDSTPAFGKLTVLKFYDANANGIFDTGETEIVGWKVNISGGIGDQFTPYLALLNPDTYIVTEYMPIELNWYATKAKQFSVVVVDKGAVTVEFGNLCTGPGGGKTLGFWSNKNGAALITTSPTPTNPTIIPLNSATASALVGLNLRDGAGAAFDAKNYTEFRSWLLSGTAVNMAYMLSVQMAAMHLNVANNLVSGSALVYAPGTNSANALGFAQVASLLAEANTELGLHGLVDSSSPYRAYQEALKNALDNANNNLTFVQATPCVFTF
jgi:hypothetical protein